MREIPAWDGFILRNGASASGHIRFLLYALGYSSPVVARSLGRRTRWQAATAKANTARTLSRPHTFNCRSPPTVLPQPKHSSIGLRSRWLIA
jgi:hypothetical protein